MRLILLLLAVSLSGCATSPATPKSEGEITVDLLRNPRTKELGLIRLEKQMNSMPAEQRQDIIRMMLRDPNLRDIGMRFVWADQTGRPLYTAPCAFNNERAIDKSKCGNRSAIARPGGY